MLLSNEDSNGHCIIGAINVMTHLIADSFYSNITSKTNLGIWCCQYVGELLAISEILNTCCDVVMDYFTVFFSTSNKIKASATANAQFGITDGSSTQS